MSISLSGFLYYFDTNGSVYDVFGHNLHNIHHFCCQWSKNVYLSHSFSKNKYILIQQISSIEFVSNINDIHVEWLLNTIFVSFKISNWL